jgi:hypothetical protein
MDHQEVAQLLGNYGEFVGAIAVVITLAYLAVQVKHSKEATEASTRSAEAAQKLSLANNHLARADLNTRSLRDMAVSDSLVKMQHKVIDGGLDMLSETEQERIRAWYLGQIYILDSQHYQYELGLIDEDSWLEAVDVIRLQAESWTTLGIFPRRSRFARAVEDIVQIGSASGENASRL